MVARSLPFHNEDQLVQTWRIGNKILASLYQRWPYFGQPKEKDEPFATASIGDIVLLDISPTFVGGKLSGLADLVRFYPPGKPTSQMHVYR